MPMHVLVKPEIAEKLTIHSSSFLTQSLSVFLMESCLVTLGSYGDTISWNLTRMN